MNWTPENREQFLKWLKDNPCMYAIGSPEYRNKNLRKLAVYKICKEMGIESHTVMMKIKSFRTLISNKKKRRKKSAALAEEFKLYSEGLSSDEKSDEPEATIGFGDLGFLAEHVLQKASYSYDGIPKSKIETTKCEILPTTKNEISDRTKNEQTNVPEIMYIPSLPSLTPVPSPEPIKKSKRKEIIDVAKKTFECVQNLIDRPQISAPIDDPDYHFFMSLYGDFKMIKSPQIRCRLKMNMQKEIFEAQFENFSNLSFKGRVPIKNGHGT